jgi:hypothetical protein
MVHKIHAFQVQFFVRQIFLKVTTMPPKNNEILASNALVSPLMELGNYRPALHSSLHS